MSLGSGRMKIGLFMIGVLAGFSLGFAVAAWALYTPVQSGPAKYALTRSAGPVPPYALDGSKKLFQIECISESAKDCPQPTSIPEPGTVALLLIGLAALAGSRA